MARPNGGHAHQHLLIALEKVEKALGDLPPSHAIEAKDWQTAYQVAQAASNRAYEAAVTALNHEARLV